MEHDTAGFMEGFGKAKGGPIIVLARVGEVVRIALEVNRFLVEGLAKPLDPAFQLGKGAFFHKPLVIAVTTVAPNLAVKNQIAMPGRV
jgi:hypothetical protein